MNPRRGDAVVGEDPLLMRLARARQPLGPEREWGEGGLQQDPAGLPLVDCVALHHSVPAAHLVLEAGTHPAGRMDPQVAAELTALGFETRPQEELGSAERAAG